MRPSILLREARGLRRGARKPARKTSEALPVLRPPLGGSDVDRSFRANAYPGPADIFRLSQQTALPPAALKAEFRLRRQALRERRGLPEDALVVRSGAAALPLPFLLLLHTLFRGLNCSRQTMLQAAVFCLSVLSVWVGPDSGHRPLTPLFLVP